MNNVISFCDYRQKKLDKIALDSKNRRRVIDYFLKDLDINKEYSYNIENDIYETDTINFTIDWDSDD
jgi:hypothetical protein